MLGKARTGRDLSGRVEQVRVALPDADRTRSSKSWSFGHGSVDPGPPAVRLGRRGLVAGGVRSSARRLAVGADQGAAAPRRVAPEWETEPLDVDEAISRYLT
jgi:hypothetical protein